MLDQPEKPPLLPYSRLLIKRARMLPWWAIALALFFLFASIRVLTSEQYTDILDYMLDRPQLTTENKYNVVYEVQSPVLVVSETLTLKLADGSRVEIPAADVLERAEGTLICDRSADANCVNEFGEIITYRIPVQSAENAAGTFEQQGIMRPAGVFVDLPNGEVVIVPEENIISQETGTLFCNRILDPACEDLEGEVITFTVPYEVGTGLMVREDVVIRHADGYQEMVRPNRLSNQRVEECEGNSETCFAGQAVYADFGERIIGTEMERTNEIIKVRTVDEQTVSIPRERVISTEADTITCDREANPRCADFEGTIVQRRGAEITGELSLENNRSVSIVPEGETAAIEILKSNIVGETRDPEDCRVEDEGACIITIQEVDDTVAGQIIEENDQEIVVQTVAPVFAEIEREKAREVRRAPLECALNNIGGCNSGIWLTLLVTFTAFAMALVIGLVVGLMRVSSNLFLFHASTLYVELIRGTPLLVLLIFFAFVIGPTIRDTNEISLFGIEIPIGKVIQPPYEWLNSIEQRVLGEENYLAEAVLGLSIGYGAFLAEVFRAGIQTIGRGQMEASRSLGMTYFQAMRHVILPQAIRIILPPLGNDFIALLKDSALISALALPDLLQNGRLYSSRTFQAIPVWIVVTLLYIILTLVLSVMVRFIERRMKLP